MWGDESNRSVRRGDNSFNPQGSGRVSQRGGRVGRGRRVLECTQLRLGETPTESKLPRLWCVDHSYLQQPIDSNRKNYL